MSFRLTVAALLLPLALLLAVGGCAPDESGSLGSLPTDHPAPHPSPQPDPTPVPSSPSPDPSPPAQPGGTETSPDVITIEVWFIRDGRLLYTVRTRPATQATSRLALTELAAGPSQVESAAGVRNAVPADLTWSVSVSGGVAMLELAESFHAGGRDAIRLREAQVVYTLTQFVTVSAVDFQVGGEPVGREAYADLLPPIVVTGPVIGERVGSPTRIEGTADVFEATVSVRILDATGTELATTFTTATCGSGCRGGYSVSVSYRVSSEQPGTIQVYEVSAADGSRTNVVDIPVVLTPHP